MSNIFKCSYYIFILNKNHIQTPPHLYKILDNINNVLCHVIAAMKSPMKCLYWRFRRINNHNINIEMHSGVECVLLVSSSIKHKIRRILFWSSFVPSYKNKLIIINNVDYASTFYAFICYSVMSGRYPHGGKTIVISNKHVFKPHSNVINVYNSVNECYRKL